MMNLICLLAGLLTFFTSTLAIPAPTLPKTAIINIEAVWDSGQPSNKTFAVPLGITWKHAAFVDLNYLYLIGAKGDVALDSIECKPYWTKKNGMSYAGLWLTSTTPSSPHDVFADLSDASLQLTCSAP